MAKGRIEATDIISKEALASIDALGAKLKLSLDVVDALIAKGKQIDKAFSGQVTMKELNKLIQDQIANYWNLDTEKKKAEKTNKDLAASQEELIKANMQETQARKDLNETLKAQSVLENKEAGTIERLVAENKKLTLERKKLNLETQEGQARLKEINAILDKNTATMRENADAATKQRMNIGNYKSALEGLPGPLGNVASAGRTATTSLKALSKVPILAAALAIIGAFVGLVKVFKSTEEGGDRLSRLMQGLKGVMNVLKQAAQSVTLALADLFSGKFRQAADHLKDGFSGLNGRMAAAYESGKKLYDALDQIGSEKLAYNIDAVREKISQLRTEAAEATDPAERAAKLNEAIKLTEEMYGKEIDWSKRTVDATLYDLSVKYGKSAEELKNFTLLSYEERNKVAESDQKLADFANKLNDEGLNELQKTITEEARLRTEFNQETLRLRRTATAAEETDRKAAIAKANEAQKERLEAQKKAFDERVKMLTEEANVIKEMQDEDQKMIEANAKAKLDGFAKLRDEELTVLNESYLKGAKSTEGYEKEKLAITQKYEKQILQTQIDNINILIATSNLLPVQKAELMAKSAELQLKIDNQLTEDLIDNQKRIEDAVMAEMEAEDKAAEKKKKDKEDRDKEIYQASVDLTAELGNAIFEINDARIEDEISAIEKKRDKEIEAAGDSKEKQAAINAKYDKLLAEQKRKQAENDKLAALFDIGINTAVAVMSSFKVDPTGILAIIVGAMGLIQAGVVLAKKIPEFKIGTKDSPGGPAIVGEEGRELMIDTYGGVQLSPERASLVYLKPHTQIIPARETDLIMQKAIENREPDRTIVNVDMEPVIEAIKNKKEYTFNFTDEGLRISEREGNWNKNYMNNFRV
jgi:hypothetical protein